VLLLAGTLWGCEDPLNVSIPEGNAEEFGVFYKEIVVPSAVYRFDSINTSGRDLLLAGRTADDEYGVSKYTSYGEVLLEFTNPSLDSALYDSLVLELPINYYYGEFPTPNTFDVYQLADTIGRDDQYSISSIPVEPNPIGTFNGELDTNVDSLLRIRLDNTIGQDLFDKAVAGDTIWKSQEAFVNYFKGLSIQPGQDNQAILGFDASRARMVLYVRERNTDGSIDTTTLNLPYQRGRRFHNIMTDRTGTSLSGLNDPYTDFIPSDDRMYLQEGDGLVVKLNLKSALDTLLKRIEDEDSIETDNPIVLFNRADLRILLDPFDDFAGPPNEIRLVYTDSLNRVKFDDLGLLLQAQADYVNQSSNQEPLRVFFDPDQRYYNAGVTSTLQAILAAEVDEQIVTIYPTTMDSRASRFRFLKDNVILRLYYTVPN